MTTWDDLTSQQQRCLASLYEQDQALEDEHRVAASRGRYWSVPASVWRRISLGSYGVVGYFELGGVSRWREVLAQLEEAGLIERIQSRRNPSVLLTRAGRAVARENPAVDYQPRKRGKRS